HTINHHSAAVGRRKNFTGQAAVSFYCRRWLSPSVRVLKPTGPSSIRVWDATAITDRLLLSFLQFLRLELGCCCPSNRGIPDKMLDVLDELDVLLAPESGKVCLGRRLSELVA